MFLLLRKNISLVFEGLCILESRKICRFSKTLLIQVASRSKKYKFQLPDPLPAGWEMRKHPSGRVLFVDNKNQDTTWIDPRTGKSSDGKTEVR
jgi:hypothetical protein